MNSAFDVVPLITFCLIFSCKFCSSNCSMIFESEIYLTRNKFTIIFIGTYHICPGVDSGAIGIHHHRTPAPPIPLNRDTVLLPTPTPPILTLICIRTNPYTPSPSPDPCPKLDHLILVPASPILFLVNYVIFIITNICLRIFSLDP